MSDSQEKIHLLNKKLLHLYLLRFKERFGESMEQTFNDLYVVLKTHLPGTKRQASVF